MFNKFSQVYDIVYVIIKAETEIAALKTLIKTISARYFETLCREILRRSYLQNGSRSKAYFIDYLLPSLLNLISTSWRTYQDANFHSLAPAETSLFKIEAYSYSPTLSSREVTRSQRSQLVTIESNSDHPVMSMEEAQHSPSSSPEQRREKKPSFFTCQRKINGNDKWCPVFTARKEPCYSFKGSRHLLQFLLLKGAASREMPCFFFLVLPHVFVTAQKQYSQPFIQKEEATATWKSTVLSQTI